MHQHIKNDTDSTDVVENDYMWYVHDRKKTSYVYRGYVEQERKTRAFAQGLSGGKRCRRTP
jgi:hypothetical protein